MLTVTVKYDPASTSVPIELTAGDGRSLATAQAGARAVLNALPAAIRDAALVELRAQSSDAATRTADADAAAAAAAAAAKAAKDAAAAAQTNWA